MNHARLQRLRDRLIGQPGVISEILAALLEDEPAQSVPVPGRWRIGRKLRRTLYLDDRCVGIVDDTILARTLVICANEYGRKVNAEAAQPAAKARREVWVVLDGGVPVGVMTEHPLKCGWVAFPEEGRRFVRAVLEEPEPTP